MTPRRLGLGGRRRRRGAAAPPLPPAARASAARRSRRGGRNASGEGANRPPGRLLWLHAASVGETLSLLPLLEALAERAPDLRMLVTTGTVTSAALLAQRLPPALAPRVEHRFAPLDVPRWVDRFLAGWRPDAGALVESELWPNLIRAARRRGIPLALVNARFVRTLRPALETLGAGPGARSCCPPSRRCWRRRRPTRPVSAPWARRSRSASAT